MHKRTSNKDINRLAASIVRRATGDAAKEGGAAFAAKQAGGRPTSAESTKKNPAAVALGRLGGLKGGRARAKKLSARRRSEIASEAAKKRWENK